MYDQETADATRILYGGSVTPDSVDELMAQPDIDGAHKQAKKKKIERMRIYKLVSSIRLNLSTCGSWEAENRVISIGINKLRQSISERSPLPDLVGCDFLSLLFV
jgi:Triosephosphate isomerase